MDFIKKNLFLLIVGLVGLLSIGGAVWASMAGAAVEEKLQQLDSLKRAVTSEASGAANPTIIEEKRQKAEVVKKAFSETLELALAKQKINAFTGEPRKPIIDGILPTPKSSLVRISFKAAFDKEYLKLFERLKARDKATPEEEQQQDQFLRGMKTDQEEAPSPWFSSSSGEKDDGEDTPAPAPAPGAQLTFKEALAQDAKARAAELVARQVYMYASERTIPRHEGARGETPPSDDQLWQAHMQLWIAQDMVVALSSVNERRAEELKKAGRAYDCWVAHMPVKRWDYLRIQAWLGRGGGMNVGSGVRFADSFTQHQNDTTKFVVPIQLELVIEEKALMEVLDAICRVGFYTPTRIEYLPFSPDPLQQEYVLGDDPMVSVRVDLEGYYFRKVFEDWINEPLKKILATPEAFEDLRNQGRG